MIDADGERARALQRRDHRRRQLEAQEVHRRGLLLVLAVEVLVGDREHGLLAGDADPHAVLDAAQLRERASPLLDVLVLDEHGRLEVAAVGHERVVRVELVLDARFLERLLDAQHLLDLVADGELVLEDQRHVIAEMDRARLLVREHARAERGALARIGFEGEQAVAGDRRHWCDRGLL
jgi:hypothetical protein